MNKDLNFEYIEDFAEYIVSRVEEDEELFVTVVGKFEEIKNIIKEIMCIAEVDFENLLIESPIMGGYEDEYVLDCWYDDGVVQIGCEPAKRDGKYLRLTGDETYLLEDCSSKVIPLCEGSKLYFVNIDAECLCDECCDEDCPCECHFCDAETPAYFINGKTATEAELNRKYEELNKLLDDFYDLFARMW